MTLEQTRQLGIEFERRVQTMIPEKELDKLDTETIFSYLNLYQDKYIHEIYRTLDQIPSGSNISAHVESILLAMLKSETKKVSDLDVINNTSSKEGPDTITISDANGITISDTGRSITFPLSEQFYMYVRSVSKVSSSFSFRGSEKKNNTSIRVIPNQLVSLSDVWKLIETPHNSLRIMRYPAAVLDKYNMNKPTLTVIYDQYTTPVEISVLYYAEPAHFDLMTSTACLLPMDAFEDLVSGAVDLYVQYVAGAEANKRRQEEAARQQLQLAQQAQNNRNRDNED